MAVDNSDPDMADKMRPISVVNEVGHRHYGLWPSCISSWYNIFAKYILTAHENKYKINMVGLKWPQTIQLLLLHNVTYIAQSDFYTMKLIQIVYFTILAAASAAASVAAPRGYTCDSPCAPSPSLLDCSNWPGTSPVWAGTSCWACCSKT
ncbi:hypothetical protein EV424DRAFT_1558721 [Suillus variegatus]|nr:hypothetical protein EV424DRAFT_1558721 [Suillus variegatus]